MGIERWLLIARLRLRSLVRHGRVEDDLAAELDDHIAHRTEEFIAAGMTPADARLAALRAFGGIEQRKEECRDARRVGYIEDFLKDGTYAIRMMRRSPGFSVVAILSLALGIGANTAIFTIFNALLLKPLPVDRPEQLRVAHFFIRLGERIEKAGSLVSFDWGQHVQRDRQIFSDALAISHLDDARVSANGRELRALGGLQFVTGNFFSMLGVDAQIGRLFAATESPHHTVVLSDRFWRREFGANPDIIGTVITVNDTPFTVIGVAPSRFFGISLGRFADAFLPLDSLAAAQPGNVTLAEQRNWMVQIVGRLTPGLSDAVASAQLTNLAQAVQPLRPGQPRYQANVLPLETGLTGVRAGFVRPMRILMAMVGLLLLISCANVATLLLARASARTSELALRRTLGASRGRLIRQLGAESLLIAVCAGMLGVVFSPWASQMLLVVLPQISVPVDLEISWDERVFFFTFAISAAAAVLSALMPALRSLKTDASPALEDRRQSASGRSSLSGLFLIAQTALCVTLLVAAGLLTRTLYGLMNGDPGFDSKGLLLIEVNPQARGYDGARAAAYYQDLFQRLRQTPSVASVTLSQLGFLGNARTTGTIDIPGFTPTNDDDRWVQVYQVGADFFTTLGISIIEGRDFTSADLVDGRVAALNETAARRFFAGRTPLNQMLPNPAGDQRIIAVVRDARYNSLRDNSVPALFVPYTAERPRLRMTFAIRVDDEERAQAAIAATIRGADPLVPMQMTTLDQRIENSLGQERFLATIAGFFALAATLLVALGVYGVMAYWVTERTAEIGVRVALGAKRAQVLWTVLQRPLRFVVIGSAIGLLISWAGSKVIGGLLFGFSAQDPVTIASVLLVMLAVAAIAGYIPARRASRVDPIRALRCD